MTLGVLKRGFTPAQGSEVGYVVYQLSSTSYAASATDPALPGVAAQSDLGALLNQIMTNFTAAYGAQGGGKIVMRGYGGASPYLQSTSVTYNKGVILQGSGDNVTSGPSRGNTVIKQADNSNLATFHNIADSVAIRDILFLGNSTNNGTSNTQGIVTSASLNVQLENLVCYDFRGIGVYINGGIVGYYKRVFCELSQQKNFFLDNAASGNTFEGCVSFGATSAATVGFYLHSGSVHNAFIGCHSLDDASLAGWWIDGSSNYNTFEGCGARNITGTTSKDGFHLQASVSNTFNGCIIRNMGQQANNTWDGFKIEDGAAVHSTNNSFVGCIIQSDAANKLKNGFEEVDANQNKNCYIGCQIVGPATNLILKNGANSRIVACPGVADA